MEIVREREKKREIQQWTKRRKRNRELNKLKERVKKERKEGGMVVVKYREKKKDGTDKLPNMRKQREQRKAIWEEHHI